MCKKMLLEFKCNNIASKNSLVWVITNPSGFVKVVIIYIYIYGKEFNLELDMSEFYPWTLYVCPCSLNLHKRNYNLR